MEVIALRDGEEIRIGIERRGRGYEVTLPDGVLQVDSRSVGNGTRSLLVDGRQYEVSVRQLEGGRFEVESHAGADIVEVRDPLTHLARRAHAASGARGLHRIEAYMPGRVVTLLVAEGDEVIAGQGLVVLEAMKMENEIQAERDGTVRKVLVEPGQAVEGGDPLFEIE